ncbi:hypothetical protein QBC38DRAFT_134839 [Podospora fimiseda]|uniref:AAA+ ATPase domain-containing protein n=1 Tax=Podospora fimiseda TaxID=252190 RepID=A0AAN7BES9_9PEZI|nr:hypothetical protein QBC38DRAFT_134839 [Podospora fimiseda]
MQPEIPSWFLNHCVKTAEELQSTKINLSIDSTDALEDIENQDGKSEEESSSELPIFEIDPIIYDQLQVVLNGTVNSSTDSPFFRETVVFLTEPPSKSFNWNDSPLFSLYRYPIFLDAVVKQFAREISADLITMTMDDIGDLCQTFLSQANKPLGSFQNDVDVYFGQDSDEPCSGTSFPFAHLLQCAIRKTTNGSKGSDTQKPLIIYMSESHQRQRYLHSYERRSNRKYDNYLLSRLAAIQSICETIKTQEMTSQTLLIISSQNLEEQQGLYFPNDSALKLLFKTASRIILTPIKNPVQTELFSNRSLNLGFTQPNIRGLQREIRRATGNLLSPPLQPYTKLENKSEVSESFLGSEVLDDKELGMLANGISPRLVSQSTSIDQILMVAARRKELLSTWQEEEEDAEGIWKDFRAEVQAKIQEIEENTSLEREQELLQFLVKPGLLTSGWSDVVLEDDIQDSVLQFVRQFTDSQSRRGILSRSRIGGALLYGPPGTGKTHLARVIAQECNITVISVSSADIQGIWAGETEKTVKALFNLGRLLFPSAIFIDEADSLLGARQSSRTQMTWERTRINQFLGEMDGLVKQDNSPMMLLATNFPQHLDRAVLRRAPFKIHIGLPRKAGRKHMLRLFLREDLCSDEVNWDELAERTIGFSGADIQTLCLQAALICEAANIKAAETNGEYTLTPIHFEKAFQRTAPTVTREALVEIRQFAMENDSNTFEKMNIPDSDGERPSKEDPTEERTQTDHFNRVPEAQTNDETGRAIEVKKNSILNGTTESDLTPLYSSLNPEGNRIRVLSLDETAADSDDSIHSIPKWKLETVSLDDMAQWYVPVYQKRSINYGMSQERRPENAAMPKVSWAAGAVERLVQAGVVEEKASEALNRRWLYDLPLQILPIKARYNWGDYIAMSYTWGDPTPEHTILLNGHEVKVRTNLYTMLEQLRTSPELKRPSIKIWIDALCIDQDDHAEKEIQVGKMDLVYKNALSVCVWLGPPPSTNAFNAALDVAQEWLTGHRDTATKDMPDLFRNTTELVFNALRTVSTALVNLPYWARLWTTQELVLATSLMFWYGDRRFTPQDIKILSRAPESWSMMNTKTPNPPNSIYVSRANILKDAGWKHSMNKLSFRDRRPGSTDAIDMGLTIQISRNCLATDPRDKVYGILALLPVQLAKTIRLSYSSSQTAWDTYTDFSRSWILHAGNLNIWNYFFDALHFTVSGDTHLPSWVFDLGAQAHDATLPICSTSGVMPDGLDFHGRANADRRQKPTFSHDGRILYCEGIIIDEVKSLSFSYIQSTQEQALSSYFRQFGLETAHSQPIQPQSFVDEHTKAALARVIHMDPEYDYLSSDGCLLNLFWRSETNSALHTMIDTTQAEEDINESMARAATKLALATAHAVLHQNSNFKIRGIPLQAFFTSPDGRFRPNGTTERDLRKLALGRFCTTKGEKIGKVPERTEIGDKIVVIFACNSPVVVRRKGDHYRVLGTCFVDGLMMGEAVGMLERGEVKAEMISFC